GRPDQRRSRRVHRRVRAVGRGGIAGPARPRAGLARLPGLARQLRPGAARALQSGDGAVRALVVGPVAPRPVAAPAMGPAPAPGRSRGLRLIDRTVRTDAANRVLGLADGPI